MTNQEARKILQQIRKQKCVSECDYDCKLYESETFCLEEKALDLAVKALEKDIAKEPVQTHKRYGHGYEYDDYYCPECDMCLAYEPQGDRYKQEGGWSRCINCGQKIKWEVKDNDE